MLEKQPVQFGIEVQRERESNRIIIIISNPPSFSDYDMGVNYVIYQRREKTFHLSFVTFYLDSV